MLIQGVSSLYEMETLIQGVSSLYKNGNFNSRCIQPLKMETLIQGDCFQSPFLISGGVMGIRFYNIESDYLSYLHKYDNQVPLHNYTDYNKFYCGVVLEINGFKYFAPVSSFSKKQSTNILIVDNGEVKGSLRFCFMVPVIDGVITEKDFSKEIDDNYRNLLEKEYRFCKDNAEQIEKMALKVYKIGTSLNHPLKKTCCKFKELEEMSLQYNNIQEDLTK